MTKTKQTPVSTTSRSAAGSSISARARRAVQRYLMLATGVTSTALGLALIVSVVAVTQAAPADGVAVSQIEGRFTLDANPEYASAQFEPLTDMPQSAEPAPPLNVESPAPEPTPASQFELLQIAVPAASPPAAELDTEAPPVPLDAAAAALPVPVLVQVQAAEVAAAVSIEPPSGTPIGQIPGVNVTFYDCLEQGFCGAMYNGQPVYEGAAACSWNLPLGTRFFIEDDPTERTYVCSDRGLLADTWVDIFFYNPTDGWQWQQSVGRYATIHILSIPSIDSDS